MSKLKSGVGLALSLLIAVPPGAFASSHREAPITALDHTADIRRLSMRLSATIIQIA